MLIRGMVEHHVEDDADMVPSGGRDQALEVSERAKLRIDRL